MPVDMKKVEAQAPGLVSLVKTAQVSLQKRGLDAHRARVAIALDISGSMKGLYSAGKVQQLAERILALGLHFDDNGAIDVFLFDSGAYNEGEMTLANFKDFIATKVMRKVGGGTKYSPVLRMMREEYFPSKKGFLGRKKGSGQADLPVYVMFVTDGAPHPTDKKAATAEIVECSKVGMFFEFMAIGRENDPEFDYLRELDDMEGRVLDNADFFEVPDPVSMSESALYDKMMTEYPGWIPQAKAAGQIA
jgi:uncharacterized protein YegL